MNIWEGKVMAKKYEVSIRFKKQVTKEQLTAAIAQATKAIVKGFEIDNIGTNQVFQEMVTSVCKPRKRKRKK